MGRDLFVSAAHSPAHVGAGQWYTVPFSIAAHAVALIVAIVIPLYATGALPTPRSLLAFAIVPPPPAPPPVTPAEAVIPPRVIPADIRFDGAPITAAEG